MKIVITKKDLNIIQEDIKWDQISPDRKIIWDTYTRDDSGKSFLLMFPKLFVISNILWCYTFYSQYNSDDIDYDFNYFDSREVVYNKYVELMKAKHEV